MGAPISFIQRKPQSAVVLLPPAGWVWGLVGAGLVDSIQKSLVQMPLVQSVLPQLVLLQLELLHESFLHALLLLQIELVVVIAATEILPKPPRKCPS